MSDGRARRRAWRSAALLGLLAALLLGARPAGADTGRPLVITGSIDGRDLAGADREHPIELDPRGRPRVQLTIRNEGTELERVRYVRLEGKALGLTFLTYDLGVQAVLQPNDRTVVDTELDFFDLESQATGYLGTSVRVYDADGFVIGEQAFVLDVLGNANSTLGSFAVIVFGLAVFSATVIVINTVRRRLPANRFVRACQFAMSGSAIGLTLSLSVSILRIGFADVDGWVRLVATPTAIAFVLGYLAPGPLSRSIRDVQTEEVLAAAAQVAVARQSGVSPALAEEALRSVRSPRLSLPDDRRSRRSLRASRRGVDTGPPPEDVQSSRR